MLRSLIILAIFPVVVKFPWNFVPFWWGFRHGNVPMPSEVKARERRVGRYLSFPVSSILALVAAYYANKFGSSRDALGLNLRHWRSAALCGLVAGVIVGVAGQAVLIGLSRGRDRQQVPAEQFLEGSLLFWVIQILYVDFAEELWRAASLRVLSMASVPDLWCVVASAIAFGVGHLGRGMHRAMGTASFAVPAAILFLWSGSLLAPYTFHVAVTFSTLFWLRWALRSRRLGMNEPG